MGISIGTLGHWIAADPARCARVREARIAAAQTFDEHIYGPTVQKFRFAGRRAASSPEGG